MKKYRSVLWILFFAITFMTFNGLCYSQAKGLRTITEKELRYHLDFLGAKEFRGRETPSYELEIATLYIGNWAQHAGLKPLMPDGSFYQEVPLNVTSVLYPGTKMVVRGRSETVYYFGKSFGGNFSVNGSYSGSIIFAGLGVNDPAGGWDDLEGLDLTGKIVVILDEPQPGENPEMSAWLTARLGSIVAEIRKRGASAVFSVVSPEKEARIKTFSGFYDYIPTGRLGIVYDSQRTSFDADDSRNRQSSATRPSLPFTQAEISHELAAGLLGLSKEEVTGMFTAVRQGQRLKVKELPDVHVKLDVEVETYKATSRNVIAVVEGSDPILKNEYVVISGHHDGRGIDDGEIIAAADDNGTAAVALMEIGQALLAERPGRSVILAWVTGEEQGMNGSHYFINNCPVPIEKITACLNMDMLGRNHADSLFLIGSDLLSSELDASIRKVNSRAGIKMGFDYRYSNLTHPQRVYFRSDHYPFIRFGIPSVWFFCGFTPDYHTYRDVTERIDYGKFLKATKLVYATAIDIGNVKNMLKLDVNPAVTSRGKHNLRESSLFQP